MIYYSDASNAWQAFRLAEILDSKKFKIVSITIERKTWHVFAQKEVEDCDIDNLCSEINKAFDEILEREIEDSCNIGYPPDGGQVSTVS